MKVILLAHAGILFGYVSAAAAPPTITSIYIPDTDPQSLSVDVLGVGSDGATTYFIHPIDGNDSSFPETLVENANHASLQASGTISPGAAVDLSVDCTIGNNSIASCTAVIAINGTTSTNIDTETASPIPVILGSVASGSSSSSATSALVSSPSSSGTTPTATANPGSTPASQPSSTSPTGSTPTNTPQPNTNGALTDKNLTTGLVAVIALNLLGIFMV